jgi:hypothetical protein
MDVGQQEPPVISADESSSNVVAFKPKPVPQLQYVEIRLNEEDCSLTLSAHDNDAGTIVTFEYTLTSKSPETFSLDELRAAWDRWRGGSTKAS